MNKKLRPDLFVSTVRDLSYGADALKASETLDKAVQRSLDTGKATTMTLKLTIKPVGNHTGQVEIKDSISCKLPELDRGMSLMFVTPDGNLTRDNPKQASMDLRSVDEATKEPKTVGAAQ